MNESAKQDRLTLTRPDDWHVHLRDGALLQLAARHTAERFSRALVMPNLQPPIRTPEEALAYRGRIMQAVPDTPGFDPIMALYLTPDTDKSHVPIAARNPYIGGYKWYPAGATTHSEAGVKSLDEVMPVLEVMARHGVILQVHAEIVDPQVDIFDREAVFVERVLEQLCLRLPELKIIVEHITTAEAAEFVIEQGPQIAATITPQHLLFERNRLFDGGLRPHYFCRPVLKSARHRDALIQAAIGGSRKFFLGTDSAPHPRNEKESACGCAGCYTACASIELYAQAFEQAGALDKLEAFASHYGADFYGYERNHDTITLTRRPQTLPETYPFGDTNTPSDCVVPLCAGEKLEWTLATD